MRDVYVTATGAYLPGPSITNDEMAAHLGLIRGKRSRLQRRILASNGITARHYAIDREGRTTALNEELAARAIENALRARGMDLGQVELLALGTTLGDALIPGFASMVHGRLGAPPMETLSAAGVCCSGMAAMLAACRALRCGERGVAVAGGSELVSRALRAARFEQGPEEREGADFDAEFIRWMLSDGAAVVVLETAPRPDGLSLRIDWVDLVSRAGQSHTCMQAGLADARHVAPGTTWLDYPTLAAAEQAGVTRIRQDIRMLDQVVEQGVQHWLRLMRSGHLQPDAIDYVLCHYSSQFFSKKIKGALERLGVIPDNGKWFSNLTTKGNTGAAAIFIALEELVNSGDLKRGDRLLLAVPESARFTTCYAHLTVVAPEDRDASAGNTVSPPGHGSGHRAVPVAGAASMPVELDPSEVTDSPLAALQAAQGSVLRRVVAELGVVWNEFNLQLARVPIIARIEDGSVTLEDYRRMLRQIRQQVVEGSGWITRAAASMSPSMAWLRSTLIGHAAEEHRDYELLERDYVAVGGELADIQGARKNVGSEALSAFIYQRASRPDPIDLLGAMFVVEGLGMRKAGHWARSLRGALGLKPNQVSFLRYHSGRDEKHLGSLAETIERLSIDEAAADRIIRTARVTSRLYALQLEAIDYDE